MMERRLTSVWESFVEEDFGRYDANQGNNERESFHLYRMLWMRSAAVNKTKKICCNTADQDGRAKETAHVEPQQTNRRSTGKTCRSLRYMLDERGQDRWTFPIGW